ncbi:hypothetical protein Rhow_007746 [Rhodococcus wratislaviensis]|uniref:Uncharacterized protein n=1 Tax=Rhodococcus wratislaviensis TaxID=44752 RepID=A0A402CIR3_RHOWR|nr:hypothetical protein Rhow_007746 [Rhodococcus wratislaviensis]
MTWTLTTTVEIPAPIIWIDRAHSAKSTPSIIPPSTWAAITRRGMPPCRRNSWRARKPRIGSASAHRKNVDVDGSTPDNLMRLPVSEVATAPARTSSRGSTDAMLNEGLTRARGRKRRAVVTSRILRVPNHYNK